MTMSKKQAAALVLTIAPGLAFAVMLAANLSGLCALSWWWVTFPLWGPPATTIGKLGILLVIVMIVEFVELAKRNQR